MAFSSSSDFIWYQCLNHPNNFSGAVGGGINTAAPITGSLSDLFPTLVANPAGGSAITVFGNICGKNQSSISATINTPQFSMPCALAVVTSPAVVWLQSTSSLDNGTLLARVLGVNSYGTVDYEETILAGVTAVTGTKVWNSISRVEIRASNPGRALTPLTGTLSVNLGATGTTQTLGQIVPGSFTGNGELDWWLETTANTTTGSANALTAPAGAAWTRSNTLVTPSYSSITYGSYISIWFRCILTAGLMYDEAVQLRLRVSGT